jgi:hypothetical protein
MYDLNKNDPALNIVVPLADGSYAQIEHQFATAPTKTLGQTTSPTGCSKGAISQMQEKAKKWIERAQGGKLNWRNLWFLLYKQFWPGVAFGISSITASFANLDQCMQRLYYNLLPLSGVRRLVSKDLRQMDRGFYGCGYPHPGVECLIAQLQKLLTVYGCGSGLGVHMQASTELLVIEGGVSMQILAQPFQCYSKWVSQSWLKSVWEKVSMFNLRVEVQELPLKMPRKRNNWIMLIFESI